MPPIGALIKKGKKLLKGKKGNPGNPGTSKRKQRKAVKVAKNNTIPQNTMSAEIGGEVSNTNGGNAYGVFGGLQKFAGQVATQKEQAMGGLVSNNPKLLENLKNITGSTNVKDFAAYFASITPAQQKEMIVQSRTNTDIDEPQGTVDKILGYASQATGIYRDASGMDDAAAVNQAKQKNTTLVIVYVSVIATVIALIFLLKNKKKVV